MNKLKSFLLAGLLSITAISGLASCGPTSDPSVPGSDPTTPTVDPSQDPTSTPDAPTSAPSVESKTVKRFKTEKMDGVLLVGQSVDLAEKITVIYEDGTEDKDFTITEGDGYIVNGSVVTFEKAGSYNLLITAGTNNKELRYAIKVETAARQAFNTWFDSISNNYTVYNVGMTESGDLEIGGFAYHGADDYFGFYFGANLNRVTAKLSDGNYYDGTFENVKSPVDFSLKFNPGVANWSNNFGSVGLDSALSSSIWSSVFDEEGNEYITADADIAETFTNYTVALTYGGSALGIQFVQFLDETNSSGLFAIEISQGEGKESVYDLWVIEDVGSTSVKVIEDYRATGALPATVPVSHIDDTFKSIALSHNYTMVAQTQFLDRTGAKVAASTLTEWNLFEYLYGTQVTFVTEDAVVVTSKGDDPQYGYFTKDSTLYNFGYAQLDDGSIVPATAPVDGTIWTNTAVSSLLAPTASVKDIEFSEYIEQDGMELFSGPAGESKFDATQALVASNAGFLGGILESLVLIPSIFQGGLADTYVNSPALTMANDPDHYYSISTLFSMSILLAPAAGVTQVTITVPWYQMERIFGIETNPYGIYYYEWVVQFGNVGTTAAPDLSTFIATIA